MIYRACILLILVFTSITAHADERAQYRAAFETASPHLRTAISYLRTGNADLASIEIEEFNNAWANAPADIDGFSSTESYPKLIENVMQNGAKALAAADEGDLETAEKILARTRIDIHRLHDRGGWTFFADCILRANWAGEYLWIARKQRPDLESSPIRKKVNVAAAEYTAALKACDAQAPDAIKSSPEFRRLIDGALESLTKIPDTVADRSNEALHRYLIELRSIDRLLFFRFG